jgi:hypothetical protein
VDSNSRMDSSVIDLVTEGMVSPDFISALDAIFSPIRQASSIDRC